MKKNNFILYCSLIFTLALFSCSKEQEDQSSINKTIFEVEDIYFDGLKADQEQIIEFKAGDKWTAILPSAWLKITPTSGEAGTSRIIIRPTLDNTSTTQRKAQLKIAVDGISEPFIVNVYQNPIEGFLALSKATLNLQADLTGKVFRDTVVVSSNRAWNLNNLPSWLSYTTVNNEKAENGKTSNIKLLLVGEYDKMNVNSLDENFNLDATIQIETADLLHSESLQVQGSIFIHSFTDKTLNEKLDTVFVVKDSVLSSLYVGSMYVKSNTQWQMKDLPQWIETTTTQTNVNKSGQIDTDAIFMNFFMKSEYLSVASQLGTIHFYDYTQNCVRSLPIKFVGTSKDYIEYDLNIPAYDQYGDDYKFEALKSADSNNSFPFKMKTTVDYATIDEAPFHLIALKAVNGIVRYETVSWINWNFGDRDNDIEVAGIFTKELVLEISDSYEKDIRDAFLFIVPKTISWTDLFVEGSTNTLKPEYSPTLVMQKSNPDAIYTLTCEKIENGGTLTIPVGGLQEFFKLSGDATQISVSATKYAMHEKYGWLTVEVLTSSDDAVTGFNLKVKPNTDNKVRDCEISFNVFRGLNVEPYCAFKFKVEQSK